MKYSVKHGIDDPQRVRTVIEKAYSSYKERLPEYNPSMEWVGEKEAKITFTVMSQTINAKVDFDSEELRIDGKVPLLFKPFQKKIESILGREMDKWLIKALTGEI